MTEGQRAVEAILAAGGAAHLDGARLLVAGADRPGDEGPVRAFLEGFPDSEQAEQCRRRLLERFWRRLARDPKARRVRGVKAVHEAERALSDAWVAARETAEDAAKFPEALRAYSRAWRAAVE